MILPMIDVPVSIIGTFSVMALLGFSLNNISLFGLVLAIGIVVDDAIVVLENTEPLRGPRFRRPHGHHQGHGRSHRADRRGQPGAVRRLRSLCFPWRHHGAILQTVRRDHPLCRRSSRAINAITMTPVAGRDDLQEPRRPWAERRIKPRGLALVEFRRPDRQPLACLFLQGNGLLSTISELPMPIALCAEHGVLGSPGMASSWLAPCSGGVLGWFAIWAPSTSCWASASRLWNRVFDALTTAYGRIVGIEHAPERTGADRLWPSAACDLRLCTLRAARRKTGRPDGERSNVLCQYGLANAVQL